MHAMRRVEQSVSHAGMEATTAIFIVRTKRDFWYVRYNIISSGDGIDTLRGDVDCASVARNRIAFTEVVRRIPTPSTPNRTTTTTTIIIAYWESVRRCCRQRRLNRMVPSVFRTTPHAWLMRLPLASRALYISLGERRRPNNAGSVEDERRKFTLHIIDNVWCVSRGTFKAKMH